MVWQSGACDISANTPMMTLYGRISQWKSTFLLRATDCGANRKAIITFPAFQYPPKKKSQLAFGDRYIEKVRKTPVCGAADQRKIECLPC